ncbi:enoyl-CoA hydratase/isomerase family protein [Paucibacter sp. R3-3]|uniref:Enoyl-CoA hydratase/isomerase family protein n=1 Tax=Roseateles agri TaxID=3098619 RepID=A0ABU5DE81_9BURK|nr:enoyl-CoA hydratase/isomerase family protein [Paucibacter sp. R3-3]MDY0744063.1 enoyl-CoA hydratase/isomerase family protein [Paucibacter sp. R3-3]
MTESLSLVRTGHVARVTLNRPQLRNAFNEEVIAELASTFDTLGRDPSLRAIVLAAEGKAFCAGADLNWMKSMAGYSWDENKADAGKLAEMLWAIYNCPVPVIARVQGDVYAGGVGLVSVCDIVVAVESAGFCLSEAKLGLLPATISPYVIRALGEQASRRYFVTAERFSAAEAHRLGLVHELADSVEALDAKVDALAGAIAANGPAAVRACKKLVQDVAHQPITPALRDDTARRIADIRASDEGRAGVQSFLNKSPLPWI